MPSLPLPSCSRTGQMLRKPDGSFLSTSEKVQTLQVPASPGNLHLAYLLTTVKTKAMCLSFLINWLRTHAAFPRNLQVSHTSLSALMVYMHGISLHSHTNLCGEPSSSSIGETMKLLLGVTSQL
jgi:hypothetical protein